MEDNLIWFEEAPVPDRFFYGPASRKAREEWNRDRAAVVLRLLQRRYTFNLLWQSPPTDQPLRIRLISQRDEELTLEYHPGIQNFQIRYEIEKGEYRGVSLPDPIHRPRHCHLAQPEENDADSRTTTDPETVPEGGDAHGDERAA